MKKFHLQCLAAAALAVALAHPAGAQRRGTGTSTVAEAVDKENSQATIDAEQQKIDADAATMDSTEESQMKSQEQQTEDNLKAGADVPAPELVPLPPEGSPDSEPAADLPLMDDLPSEQLSPDELPDPNTLIPDEPPPDEAPAAPVITENKFEKERKLRVRYEEVKLQASKDQAIRDMRAKADAAKTDEGKRAALREYYRMLFARIVSIDAELQDKANVLEQAYLRRLGQFRVEPTIPLNPPPTPEALTN